MRLKPLSYGRLHIGRSTQSGGADEKIRNQGFARRNHHGEPVSKLTMTSRLERFDAMPEPAAPAAADYTPNALTAG